MNIILLLLLLLLLLYVAMNNKIRLYNINHNGNISSKQNPIRTLSPSQLVKFL